MARPARDTQPTTIRLLQDRQVGGRDYKAGDWVSVTADKADKWVERGMADHGLPWDSTAEKHVLMVSKHCCTRVTKQALALKRLGYRVDSVSVHMPKILDGFENLRLCDPQDMALAIHESGAQIIHVHNEPDRLMRWADMGARGRPVVYDCHDLAWYRNFAMSPDEEFAFSRADGIIHVSAEHRAQAWKLHKWDAIDGITYSCPMREWTPPDKEKEQRRGVVYEGGSRPGVPDTDGNRFRDHTKVAAAFEKAGIPFDLFVPAQAQMFYKRARLMVPYKTLVHLLTNYEWGFIGTDIKTGKGDTCLPNKLFEYMMAGLPIIGANVPAVERFMDGKGGIYGRDMDKIIAKMRTADWFGLQAEAIARRRYMDDEIENTVTVYEALLGAFQCPHCGKKMKDGSGYAGHVRTQHPAEWKASREAVPDADPV